MNSSTATFSTFPRQLRRFPLLQSNPIFEPKRRVWRQPWVAGCLLFLALTATAPVSAQATKTVSHSSQSWLGYFNQSRFSKRWGSWVDAHYRTKDNLVKSSTLAMLRLGATYYINTNTKITAGYAYINHFPTDNHKNISQPEHRPWQQVQWHSNSTRFKVMQWVRLEERFRRKILNDNALNEGFHFNWRTRYNVLLQVPLSKKAFQPGSFSLSASNEIFINWGKKIVYNTFDQNRFFVGLHYHTNSHDWLQFGYMNVFQQLAGGNSYKSTHALRLFYFQNLNFTKN
jgi:hypothetical protein